MRVVVVVVPTNSMDVTAKGRSLVGKYWVERTVAALVGALELMMMACSSFAAHIPLSSARAGRHGSPFSSVLIWVL